ncbi:MAG: amidase family protein [Aliidongia sp.]
MRRDDRSAALPSVKECVETTAEPRHDGRRLSRLRCRRPGVAGAQRRNLARGTGRAGFGAHCRGRSRSGAVAALDAEGARRAASAVLAGAAARRGALPGQGHQPGCRRFRHAARLVLLCRCCAGHGRQRLRRAPARLPESSFSAGARHRNSPAIRHRTQIRRDRRAIPGTRRFRPADRAAALPRRGRRDGAGGAWHRLRRNQSGSPPGPAGCSGLKPSRGRCPQGPAAAERVSGLNVEFVLTRSLRDTAAFLDILAAPDSGGPYRAPSHAGSWITQPTKPLRVGLTTRPAARRQDGGADRRGDRADRARPGRRRGIS